MSKKRMTDLERRIRWWFENIDINIDLESLEMILLSEWNEMRDKLILDPSDLPREFQDLLALAKKMKNPE